GLTWNPASLIGGAVYGYTPATNLAEITHHVVTRVVDQAGNASSVSPVQDITIDHTAPTATAVISSISPDSGISASDYNTNTGNLT
ncbi:hypothetical protein, partial [Mesorhizobium japonicum]|uniref:hypothetical protein n=1 Tax=Mesorhizobium japonicum TaxID=2066070 RepID=UPI003B59C52B